MNDRQHYPGVLVTHGRNRIAYAVIRSLSARGVAVHVGDSKPGSMCSSSRFAAGSFVYPSPFDDQVAFVESLGAEALRRDCSVIIPVLEEGFALARHRDRLPEQIRTPIPSYSQILLAHDKLRWAEVADELEVATPKSVRADLLAANLEAADSLRYPVLLKPRQGGGAWAIEHFSDPSALRARLSQPALGGVPWDRFFVQERIEGRVHCAAVVAVNGKVRASVGYRQLRELPITGGQATARCSDNVPGALDALTRLAARTEWHGVCQADFVIDESSGVPYLIDLNPRLWGSLIHAMAAGVDVPWLLYRIALDGDIETQCAPASDTVTRWLGGELGVFISALKSRPKRWDLLRQVASPWPRSKDWDDFVPSDPRPLATWLWEKFRGGGGLVDSLDGIWT